ncbi:iron-containing alcohol dehydrogenase [Natronospora cellulosivora (SeqCode)]
MVDAFDLLMPEIKFGPGKFQDLAEIIKKYGDKVLLLTGGSSLKKSGHYQQLIDVLKDMSIDAYTEKVRGEPSPELVDEIVAIYREKGLELVVAIGGGSVMDAGKAISALLTKDGSVMDYLEGVGAGMIHDGEKIPFIAVPTTSGTGSEATKNAVLSRVGENGFKKSLRHDNFVPDLALVDPELTLGCPASITAASGMDALTQLMGAYLSTNANPMIDSLCLKATEYALEAVLPVSTDQPDNLALRSKMAYASLVSGIALANVGLGIVHGLASPIGGFFDIPHGVVCGTLLGEASALNIRLLQEKNTEEADFYLQKYARVGTFLSDDQNYIPAKKDYYCDLLINTLRDWVVELDIPRLGKYGVSEDDLDKIVEKTGIKNNPVELAKEDIKQLLIKRL